MMLVGLNFCCFHGAICPVLAARQVAKESGALGFVGLVSHLCFLSCISEQ